MPRTIAYPPELLPINDWFEYIYNETRKPMPKPSNVNDVITNKGIRAASSFICKPNGEKFYSHEGREIPEKEFENMYPIEVQRVNVKGDNCDKRQLFLNNKKSF